MEKKLIGRRIVVMVANGFDERDFSLTQRLLASQGAMPKIISPENGLVNSWRAEDGKEGWGHHFPVDSIVSTVLAADYDGMLIIGGHRSIDKLKENAHCRRIMRGFMDACKPVMLLGQAVAMLSSAERAKGYVVTGDAALAPVLTEAGATWVEADTYTDGHLATATMAQDGGEFTSLVVDLFLQTPEQYDIKQAA
ncbi:MAG TPA: DJ-1/PfpI family protein [Alphaproteobacteria bacterium]